MSIELRDYQLDAIERMKNGCILCGSVGSGKSRTALAYFHKACGGGWKEDHSYIPRSKPKDLYIITTARKRDTAEWEIEMCPFLLSKDRTTSGDGTCVTIDSWNNIKKYKEVENAFFIFDEQRVVGKGEWVKSFLKIAKHNEWILLSATPGDTWSDYIPVFIANGFYKNPTEFSREHIRYSPYSKTYPIIAGYLNTGRLLRLRNDILVDMDYSQKTVLHHESIYTDFDIVKYKTVIKKRWDPYNDEPIQQITGLCYILRRISNEDESRQRAVLEIFEKRPKLIIFYNFNYELEILKSLYFGKGVQIAEWNGHIHQPIPKSKRWVYLVQYTAGAEGWNCVETDTIIFFSQNYSYKTMQQAAGRINRLNTPFKDLYYYHLKSRSSIDLAISKALSQKKKFNESRWFKW